MTLVAVALAAGCGDDTTDAPPAAGGASGDAMDAPATHDAPSEEALAPDATDGGDASVPCPDIDDELVRFMRENPDRSAFSLLVDGAPTVHFNADRSVPLASTAKIVIGVEYAEQVVSGLLDPESFVGLDELAIYYVAKTDGGAHPAWLDEMQTLGRIDTNRVRLKEVLRGMLKWSSNANAEYLEARLGLDAVNQRVDTLALASHEPFFYIVSSLFLLRNPTGKTEPDFIAELRAQSDSEWATQANALHAELGADTSGAFKGTLGNPSLALQDVWSDHLPASTTDVYADLMQRINVGSALATAARDQLAYGLEWPMEQPGNRTLLTSFGHKGGSTASIFTHAGYVTLKSGGTTLAFAVFFDDLTLNENTALQNRSNDFLVSLLTEPDFRADLAIAFSTPCR